MINIALVGAFDRYNYGDVIMPIVLKKELEKNFENDLRFDFFGLKSSNMEHVCGVNCDKLSNIYLNEYDVVIVVGGDVLTVPWISMYLNLQTSKSIIFLLRVMKKFSYRLSNYFAKKALKGRTIKPWILDKSLLKCEKLLYNTVGGQVYLNTQKKERDFIDEQIRKFDYISVRNEKNFEIVKKINSNTYLYPDSVISLSKIIDYEEVLSNVRKDIIEKLEGKKYIVFQVKNEIGKKYYDKIISEIKKINNALHYNVVLLPIGYAQGHEDQVILSKIRKELSDENILFDFNNIYEIIYIISRAQIFVGTSLHGLITSISYGVPHIAFTSEISKQIDFLNTWKTTPIIYTDADNMFDNINIMLNDYEKNVNIVKKQCNEMQRLVFENFDIMNSIIKKGKYE